MLEKLYLIREHWTMGLKNFFKIMTFKKIYCMIIEILLESLTWLKAFAKWKHTIGVQKLLANQQHLSRSGVSLPVHQKTHQVWCFEKRELRESTRKQFFWTKKRRFDLKLWNQNLLCRTSFFAYFVCCVCDILLSDFIVVKCIIT